MSLTAADLDVACSPLLAQLRARRVVSEAELTAIVPVDHEDAYAWLSCYGQLRAWVSGAGSGVTADSHDQADALVARSLRQAPVPLPEIGNGSWAVYDKSFQTLTHLLILDAQLNRLTARLVALTADGTTLDQIDDGLPVAEAVAYVTHLIVWTWITPGAGLPFDARDPAPVVPESVSTLSSLELLHIHRAIATFAQQTAALQVLIDPIAARDNGRRPSWSGLFESLGAEAHVDPGELAVTYGLNKVLAMTRLAGDRHRPVERDA
jgi:hypothetical protein